MIIICSTSFSKFNSFSFQNSNSVEDKHSERKMCRCLLFTFSQLDLNFNLKENFRSKNRVNFINVNFIKLYIVCAEIFIAQ